MSAWHICLERQAPPTWVSDWPTWRQGSPQADLNIKRREVVFSWGWGEVGVHYFLLLSLFLYLSLSLLGQGWKRLTEAGEETCHERWWHSHGDTSTSSLFPKLAFAAQAAASDRVQKSLNLSLFSPPDFLKILSYFLVCGSWDFNHVEGKRKKCIWKSAAGSLV